MAAMTGETKTQAATEALRDRLERLKRRHAANLKFGDCFSYARAKAIGFPLLSRETTFHRLMYIGPSKERGGIDTNQARVKY